MAQRKFKNHTRNRFNKPPCPSCGSHTQQMAKRVKGKRYYVTSGGSRRGDPNRPVLRVYYNGNRSGSWRRFGTCPDPYHKPDRPRGKRWYDPIEKDIYVLFDDEPLYTATPGIVINKVADPETAEARKTRKAKRERSRQGKDRR